MKEGLRKWCLTTVGRESTGGGGEGRAHSTLLNGRGHSSSRGATRRLRPDYSSSVDGCAPAHHRLIQPSISCRVCMMLSRAEAGGGGGVGGDGGGGGVVGVDAATTVGTPGS